MDETVKINVGIEITYDGGDFDGAKITLERSEPARNEERYARTQCIEFQTIEEAQRAHKELGAAIKRASAADEICTTFNPEACDRISRAIEEASIGERRGDVLVALLTMFHFNMQADNLEARQDIPASVVPAVAHAVLTHLLRFERFRAEKL